MPSTNMKAIAQKIATASRCRLRTTAFAALDR